MAGTLSTWPPTKLPLASLTPETPNVFINAVVTLIWPFSPSSRSLSIVASEEDFRLRLAKGQLRVNFNGAAAAGVDARGLQIGDHVCISLEGAVWEEVGNATARDVPWSVSFEKRLAMKVKTSDDWDIIDIDAPTSPEPELPVVESSPSPARPQTPPETTPFSFSRNGNEWATPGLFKRRLTSSNDEPSSVFAIGSQGLFDEEDEYDLGHRKKRPRFSSSYRFEDEGEESMVTNDVALGIEEEEAVINVITEEGMVLELPEVEQQQLGGHPEHIDMPPPPLPLLALNTSFGVMDEILENAPDSPNLRPVPSEQLPIISPFLGKGLAGTDYMGAILDSSLRAREVGVIAEAVSPVFGAGESPQGTPTTQEPTGNATAANDPPGDLSVTPEVFIVPAEDDPTNPTTTTVKLPTTPTKPPTPGPSHAQQLADQRRGSLSEEDRLPSDYESEKDSLFDEFSDNEMRRRVTKPRTIGRSPLKSVESLKPRRSTPLSKPSRLVLESTPSSEKTEGVEKGEEHPLKTPFLYLPTPSPKIERRGMNFPPTSAPPKFLSRGYEDSLGGCVTISPIRRKSSFWGMREEEPVPNDMGAYFGRPRKKEESEREVGSVSGTDEEIEEEISGFSTPAEGEDDDDDDDDDGEFGVGLGGGFRSGVTTNLSDFPALSSLTWDAVVDIIAVVSRFHSTKRAKGGQQDWYMSMRVVDSSLTVGMEASIFRPHKEALPVVEVGNVVLLRSFKISSYKRSFVATSTTNSAWAVWKDHGKGRPAIAGPPVEYGEGEEAYVERIGAWYEGLDFAVREEMERESEEEVDV